jgi:lysyl-tRNA synthetase class 2
MDALRMRARLNAFVRKFFEERGVLEVETPVLSMAGNTDPNIESFTSEFTGPVSAGPSRRWLRTSPEFALKRLLAAGVGHCYELGRVFRNGEAGRTHNPEFTMLEWYRSFARYEEVIEDTEALVVEAARALGHESVSVGGNEISLARPFRRMTVSDAFAAYANTPAEETLALAEHDELEYFRRMIDQVEPAIADLRTPVFLVDYPASQASLARRKPEDSRWAERFELFIGGIELCNGFGELTDAREQRQRLERDQRERRERSLEVYPIDERFLDALESGMPPSAGNALGLDRLVALAAGATCIADVQAFPSREL